MEQSFDVIFEGRPLSGVSRERAVQGFATLSRKSPEAVSALFTGQPQVLKRGLSEDAARRYVQTLRGAGLACRMLSSGHGEPFFQPPPPADVRPLSPGAAPEIPSPSPGPFPGVPPPPVSATAEPSASFWFHFPDRGFWLSLASLSCLLPETLELEKAPEALPSAPLGLRIWAAISSFFHIFFMFMVMQVPVGGAAGVWLLWSEASLTRSLLSELKGVAGLLAMISTFVLLPLLWRGHSFGQRAMGILVLPRDGDVEALSGGAMLLRRLTFRARCVMSGPRPSRPWNSALLPFAATVVLHFALALPMGAFVRMMASIDGNLFFGGSSYARPVSDGGWINHSRQSIPEEGGRVTPRALHLMHQVDAVMRIHMLESGAMAEALSPSLFRQILGRSGNSGFVKAMMARLEKGSLKIEGDLSRYRISLREGEGWLILDEEGDIQWQETFYTPDAHL